MTRSWELVIDWLGRPLTVNRSRTLHHHARARVDRAWREAGASAAMVAKVPSLRAVTIEAWGRYPDRRALPDPDGIQPAVKAAVDGLADRGVVPDDNAQHVHAITYRPPVVAAGELPGLALRITEVES